MRYTIRKRNKTLLLTLIIIILSYGPWKTGYFTEIKIHYYPQVLHLNYKYQGQAYFPLLHY